IIQIMKLFSLLVAFFFFCGCNCKKAITPFDEGAVNLDKLPILVFEARTRGYFKKITIEEGRIYVQTAREAKPVYWELAKEDYKQLSLLYQKINVKSLAELVAPTEKRFYDAEPFASFFVISQDSTYKTPDFDAGFPPAHIEKIVKKMVEIAEKLNR